MGEQEGLFTIQYPEERSACCPSGSATSRCLLYETNAETGAKEDRCTACGICAKVCPPQCIWIVRDKDENGKPITGRSEFYIDTTICMNCGLCAEFCPFDAIKMNHDFEITAYKRMPHLVFDLEELSVPVSYYARIRPTDYAEEEAAKKAKEAEKAARPVEKVVKPASPPRPPAPRRRWRLLRRLAKPPAACRGSGCAAAVKRTPEEIERLKAEAAARRAAKASGEPAAGEGAEGAPAAAAPACRSADSPAEAAAGGKAIAGRNRAAEGGSGRAARGESCRRDRRSSGRIACARPGSGCARRTGAPGRRGACRASRAPPASGRSGHPKRSSGSRLRRLRARAAKAAGQQGGEEQK